jgi:hypothetical protein
VRDGTIGKASVGVRRIVTTCRIEGRGDGHDQSTLVGKGLTRTVIEQPGAACGVSVFGKVPHMVRAGGRVTQHRLCLDRHYTRNNWIGIIPGITGTVMPTTTDEYWLGVAARPFQT